MTVGIDYWGPFVTCFSFVYYVLFFFLSPLFNYFITMQGTLFLKVNVTVLNVKTKNLCNSFDYKPKHVRYILCSAIGFCSKAGFSMYGDMWRPVMGAVYVRSHVVFTDADSHRLFLRL